MYPEKFILDDAIAPFLLRSAVIVTLPSLNVAVRQRQPKLLQMVQQHCLVWIYLDT